jgi:5-methylcytosine-specific restriction endonuclease McrA
MNSREEHITPAGGFTNTMLVYVRNQESKSLMPCTPAKARKLLRTGRAKVVERSPFTIRCDHRKSRRKRKWYRPKRLANRASSKRSGRLPPTIKTNVGEVIRVVKHIPLPIAHIVIEDVQVDIARLTHPELKGSQYQDTAQLDENLRIACLMRDGYHCQQCGKQKVRLEAHHIVYREHGGKDTLSNLLTLCSATFRKARDLPKTHIVDALCLATYHSGEVVPEPEVNIYLIRFRPRQTRKQYHSLPQKGKGRVRYQRYEELEAFRKGDIVQVKGKWIKQVNPIYAQGRLAFKRVKGEPANAKPQDCRLLRREQTVIWENVAEKALQR